MDNARVVEGASKPKAADDDRRFGYWVGHFAVVGSMVGAGILTTSGYTLQKTGNPAALIGLWIVGGVLAICGALCIAEMATALPRSGGDYVFVREAFGQGAGFVSGWATFILGFAAPTALLANASLSYLVAGYQSFSADRWDPGQIKVFVQVGASILILAMGITHSLGHRHSSRLQLSATILTGSILLAISIGGIILGRGDWNHFSVGGWPLAGQWQYLAAALIYVGFAYGGWSGAGYLAGEIRNPAWTLPRCLIGGTATVMVLYLLVNVVYVFALDPPEMTKKQPEDVKAVAKLAVDAMFGSSVAGSVSIAFGLCLLSTLSASLLTGPRIVYAMANDGVFPGYAGRLHASRRTPVAATLTQVVVGIALIWAGSFLELLNFASSGFVAISALTVVSVFPIRRRSDLPHPYKLWLYPIPPLAYLILVVWTIGNALMDEDQWIPTACSLGIIAVGILLSRFIRKK